MKEILECVLCVYSERFIYVVKTKEAENTHINKSVLPRPWR